MALVIIPARYASKRLPGKMLADIAGEPMIVHVWRRAVEADVGPVYVATDHDGIAQEIAQRGGEAVPTSPDHLSGTDRVGEAVDIVDLGRRHEIVVNLQGDMPTIPPAYIARAAAPLRDPRVDIGTLVARPTDWLSRLASVSKAALSNGRAVYFTRAAIEYGHPHIGVYAFRRRTLERFRALPRGVLEAAESLEQLRALEAGMNIGAEIVDVMVDGVDTETDLEAARRDMKRNEVRYG